MRISPRRRRRILRVRELQLQGHSPSSIAKSLNCSISTVQADLRLFETHWSDLAVDPNLRPTKLKEPERPEQPLPQQTQEIRNPQLRGKFPAELPEITFEGSGQELYELLLAHIEAIYTETVANNPQLRGKSRTEIDHFLLIEALQELPPEERPPLSTLFDGDEDYYY